MIDRRSVKVAAMACVLALYALAAQPAFAVNKDMVQLQTQIQDLQESVNHLQQSNDERMGVMRDLVQQTADSVNKMSVAVGSLETQMRAQQEATSTKQDQISGQVQSLNDSLDEVKARLNGLEKAMQSVANQQQSINAALQNMTPAVGSTQAVNPVPQTTDQPAPQTPAVMPAPAGNGKPTADVPFPANQGPYANVPAQALTGGAPVADLYSAALKDNMAAKYTLATSEFQQVIQTNPNDPLAGNSYYYLGEIDYHAGKFTNAVRNYDHVLTQYPSNPKIPVSRLHKAMALLQMKERDAAVTEFRALIQRFPNSPEAAQARTKLSGLGIRPAPRSE
jgi:tol-pal system protein YbgF